MSKINNVPVHGNPFEEPTVGVSEKKKQENNKMSKRSVKVVLDSYKKNVRELKKRKRDLEKRLNLASGNERQVIQDLLLDVQNGFAAIATETKSITTELISINPNSRVSQRVVEKMGYQTVQGYLRDNYSPFVDNTLDGKLLTARNGHQILTGYGAISGEAVYMNGQREVRELDPRFISKFGNIAMQSEEMIEGETKSGHRR